MLEPLAVRDHMTLALAAAPYRFPAERANRARFVLGYSEPAFWRRVEQLLADPRAEAAHPHAVARLKRLREARRLARSA